MNTKSVRNESHVQFDSLAISDESRLVASFTDSLIQWIALAVSADVVQSGGGIGDAGAVAVADADQVSVSHGKKQLELLFADIRKQIEKGELPPRFVAELAKHYLEVTGRDLKSDLGANAVELDRSFQVAIDVASRRTLQSGVAEVSTSA